MMFISPAYIFFSIMQYRCFSFIESIIICWNRFWYLVFNYYKCCLRLCTHLQLPAEVVQVSSTNQQSLRKLFMNCSHLMSLTCTIIIFTSIILYCFLDPICIINNYCVYYDECLTMNCKIYKTSFVQ